MPARIPVPLWKDSNATSETSPLPRHRARSMFDARPTSRANHPTYHDHQLHLVHNTADNHDGTSTLDDNRGRPHGANVSPTAGSTARGEYAMPAGDRRPDREALVPVRTGRGAVGDRDRLARVELPTRRSESGAMFQCPPVGPPLARRVLRGSRVSRLVRSAFRRRGQHCSSCTALRVCWFVTLATLTWVVL